MPQFRKVEFAEKKINYLLQLDPEDGRVLVNNLIQSFLLNTPKNIDLMIQALSEKDYEKIFDISHKMKSSAGNLGVNSVMHICEEIQNIAAKYETSEVEKLDSLLSELKFHFHETSALLNDLRRAG